MRLLPTSYLLSLIFFIAASLMNPQQILPIILMKFLVSIVLKLRGPACEDPSSLPFHILALDLLETWQTTVISIAIVYP